MIVGGGVCTGESVTVLVIRVGDTVGTVWAKGAEVGTSTEVEVGAAAEGAAVEGMLVVGVKVGTRVGAPVDAVGNGVVGGPVGPVVTGARDWVGAADVVGAGKMGADVGANVDDDTGANEGARVIDFVGARLEVGAPEGKDGASVGPAVGRIVGAIVVGADEVGTVMVGATVVGSVCVGEGVTRSIVGAAVKFETPPPPASPSVGGREAVGGSGL